MSQSGSDLDSLAREGSQDTAHGAAVPREGGDSRSESPGKTLARLAAFAHVALVACAQVGCAAQPMEVQEVPSVVKETPSANPEAASPKRTPPVIQGPASSKGTTAGVGVLGKGGTEDLSPEIVDPFGDATDSMRSPASNRQGAPSSEGPQVGEIVDPYGPTGKKNVPSGAAKGAPKTATSGSKKPSGSTLQPPSQKTLPPDPF